MVDSVGKLREKSGRKDVLWLAHVRVEVVEITQLLRPEARIGICRVVSLMMFNVDKDVVFSRFLKEFLVVF
jgi:hypothetical protein